MESPSSLPKFVGVWKLIRFEQKTAEGQLLFPYGEHATGRITYDSAGRMSAMLMRNGRKSVIPAGTAYTPANADPGEAIEAVTGFTAYYGTYEVVEATQTVIHHVEASLVPSWVGTDLRRTFQFMDNRLLLRARSASATLDLTWERESD